MGQSGYLKRIEQEKDELTHNVEHIIEQYMVDTLHIAANRCEGMGYDRLMRLTDGWKEVQREYRAALSPIKNPEADVAQEHMDRELERIIRKKAKLIPFLERYPKLKKVKYGRRK